MRSPATDPQVGDIVQGVFNHTLLHPREITAVDAHTVSYVIKPIGGRKQKRCALKETWRRWCAQAEARIVVPATKTHAEQCIEAFIPVFRAQRVFDEHDIGDDEIAEIYLAGYRQAIKDARAVISDNVDAIVGGVSLDHLEPKS